MTDSSAEATGSRMGNDNTESEPIPAVGEGESKIPLFEDLSQKSEKEERCQNSSIPFSNADTGVQFSEGLTEKEGIPLVGNGLGFPQPEGNQASIIPEISQIPTAGEAIPLMESRRGQSIPSSGWTTLIFFCLGSFSICSGFLNIYLFWQARNLGAELEKRPPAPRNPSLQKR